MRKNSDRENYFRFPCNKELNVELGRFDALIQLQEVALLDLLHNYEIEEKKESIDKYIFQKAVQHDISLRNIPFASFKNKIHQSYLIYPYACLDVFLHSFVHEVKGFFWNESLNKSDFELVEEKGLSYLDRIIKSLKKLNNRFNFPQLYVDIYDYFRLARNEVAHKSKDNTDVITAYNKIDIDKALELLPRWKNAFRQADIFELDDIVAFAAFSKRIADLLPQRIYPLIDWTKVNYFGDEKWVEQIKKTKAKYDKTGTFQGYVKQQYGEYIPDNQIEEVYVILKFK